VSSQADKFATPRVAAGVLFRDDTGRVLLVKPTYKGGWEIPGGYVERGESPRAAAVREVAEELGADLGVAELLVLDWAPHPAEGDKLLVIFRGRTLDQTDVDRLRLDTTEISEARFFPVERLADLMPERLARRVAEAARQDSGTYLEHGRSLTAPIKS
jgi:8-oxo-dGTP pyrophosphatase MutT (NUDIX family)